MARSRPDIEHLLRRAGFGAGPDDLRAVEGMSASEVLNELLDYEKQPDDIDGRIGDSAYLAVVSRGGPFSPDLDIEHARQRWLFRMMHTRRPLQEKMTLFWHNHFATAYSKLAVACGSLQAAKLLGLKRGALAGPQGQIDLFRQHALGHFRDLLVEVARHPAMIIWLDGRLNIRERPQENFARELLELFTLGAGHYTEQDVYAAARVFTGWNLGFVGSDNNDPNAYCEFRYEAHQHDLTSKTFSFPVYENGSTTIPARASSAGMQDGLDLLTALATHPATARRLATRLWNYFISEVQPPDSEYLRLAASVYMQSGTRIGPLVRFILDSRWFHSQDHVYARYAWPVEFVIRATKEVGHAGFSADAMLGPLAAMGQSLFEPPDVSGWKLADGWFSTATLLARMNFGAILAQNQRVNLARDAASARSSPDALIDLLMRRLSSVPFEETPRRALVSYLLADGTWNGSDAQLQSKVAAVARLIVGSSEYQLV